MRVITSNPIISNNKVVNSDSFYLSAEGDPKMLAAMNKRQVQAFQDYMNVKYPNWYIPTKGILPKNSPKYGDKTDTWTAMSWKSYGDDWYKGAMGITKAIESTNPFSIWNLFSTTPKSQPKEQTQPELPPPPPPPKKLSMTTKILIGAGSVVVLGTIIYLITRKK
jgi:hypothetical protein